MRTALTDLWRTLPAGEWHLGLAYDVLAPVDPATGRINDDDKRKWLESLSKWRPAGDYARYYKRWEESLTHDSSATIAVGRSRSRLLVGHGNPSPTEVGLTVHRTWGVPVVPGSAIKGLLSHFLDATFGPIDVDSDPREKDHPEPERAPYQGVTYSKEGRPVVPPGSVHEFIFGSPDIADWKGGRPSSGLQGGLVFHDALLLPGQSQCFAPDTVTPHHGAYYSSAPDKRPWPNDYEDPVPVGFLSVVPRMSFLFAISGDTEWSQFAMQLLTAALSEWGIGAKTAAGYGRFDLEIKSTLVDDFEAFVLPNEPSQRQRLNEIESLWMPRLQAASPQEKAKIIKLIEKAIKRADLRNRRDDLIAEIGS